MLEGREEHRARESPAFVWPGKVPFSYVSRGIGSGGAWPLSLELWVMACSWTNSAHGQTVSQAVLRHPQIVNSEWSF